MTFYLHFIAGKLQNQCAKNAIWIGFPHTAAGCKATKSKVRGKGLQSLHENVLLLDNLF